MKVTDKQLLEALGKNRSIRQALISVGLHAKGNNYYRARKLLDPNYVPPPPKRNKKVDEVIEWVQQHNNQFEYK